MGKEKNVFISHHSSDDEHIQKLKDLLATRGYTLKNSSVDSSKCAENGRIPSDEAIKRLLRLRIQWAGTVICLVGNDTHSRYWVDWEIEQAHLKGKPIHGVTIFGESDAVLPMNLEKYADSINSWNTDNIIDALEGRETKLTSEYGIPAGSPVRDVIKVGCK
jgi:hypothetical protein